MPMRISGIQRIKRHLEQRRHKRFVTLFDLPKKGSLLDISCGDGNFLSIVQKHFPELDLNGVDISKNCIEQACLKYPHITFSIAHAESLPYKDRTFAVVLSCMSLHHYKDPQKIFSEISRVLTTVGNLYLIDLVPRHRWLQLIYNWDGCPEPYHFERYYLRSEIESFASAVGLYLHDIRMSSRFSSKKILVFNSRKNSV
jgi:ubiquinone/menaquinone biosynthesis C-methylase UbiE